MLRKTIPLLHPDSFFSDERPGNQPAAFRAGHFVIWTSIHPSISYRSGTHMSIGRVSIALSVISRHEPAQSQAYPVQQAV
jgi:hypothetical protein